MAESEIKNELKAIETITNILGPLDKTIQQRVLRYAMQHLGLADQSPPALLENIGTQVEQPNQRLQQQVVDIRSLHDQKQPSSDMEMAAIVAYYLSELAPEENRKDTIGTEDIKKYFNQAGHPLPKGYQFTLPNAKSAGYFESAGRGKYKLNPVGYNLVAYGLPRAKGESPSRPIRRKTKGKKKAKSSKKKTG